MSDSVKIEMVEEVGTLDSGQIARLAQRIIQNEKHVEAVREEAQQHWSNWEFAINREDGDSATVAMGNYNDSQRFLGSLNHMANAYYGVVCVDLGIREEVAKVIEATVGRNVAYDWGWAVGQD